MSARKGSGDYGCTKAFSHGIIVGKCRSKCRAPVFEPVRGILVIRSKWQLLIMFMKLWNANTLDSVTLLFICYIVDERIESFGDRWMAEGQIRNIQQWEIKHSLDSTLSSNYGTSLQFLIQNNLVHESSWTSYGNPREYSLYPSIRNLLFNCPKGIQEALQTIKDKHYQDQELPF